MTRNPLNVFMSSELVDKLVYGFSPGDGITAIDNVFGELPDVHRPRRPGRGRRTLPVYNGRLAWYPLGFTYVQFGNELHVLRVWEDEGLDSPGRPKVDSVVGRESA